MSKLSVVYNSILIIESLPEDDYKTGEVLSRMLKESHPEHSGIQYIPVASKGDFIDLMQEIRLLMQNNQAFRPIIDIETHGNKSEIGFADDSRMPWKELMDIFRGLNEISKNELVVFLACCEGYHFVKSTTISKHSPCGYLFSPQEEISVLNVINATVEFFNEITVNGDLDLAADLMKQRGIYCFKSEIFFLNALTIALIKDFEGENKMSTDSERESLINNLSNTYLGGVKDDYTKHVIKCFHEHVSK
ncbi:hypothetical protein ACVR25_002720 [Cronobacter sakazakii]|uniref:hypothetical protein n=1 Tax=Cronobacter sakazakii TaxID=28141 RepID=UPI000A197519|nr:hypothetical protein [Cronobacter sakazakii]PRC65817.1 hypothetical protein B8W49_09465 [Cronobacter sakazakii]